MKTTTSSKGNIVAIITMMFLFAMISFVTNLAAPVGVIWKNTFAEAKMPTPSVCSATP